MFGILFELPLGLAALSDSVCCNTARPPGGLSGIGGEGAFQREKRGTPGITTVGTEPVRHEVHPCSQQLKASHVPNIRIPLLRFKSQIFLHLPNLKSQKVPATDVN